MSTRTTHAHTHARTHQPTGINKAHAKYCQYVCHSIIFRYKTRVVRPIFVVYQLQKKPNPHSVMKVLRNLLVFGLSSEVLHCLLEYYIVTIE